MATLLTPATAADRTGVSLDTLRYYEREGLIGPIRRSPGERREYTEAAGRQREGGVLLHRQALSSPRTTGGRTRQRGPRTPFTGAVTRAAYTSLSGRMRSGMFPSHGQCTIRTPNR